MEKTELDVQFLIDKHLIEQNFVIYGRLVDEKRFDELDLVFTSDVTMVVTQPTTIALQGLDAVIGAMRQRLGPEANCRLTHHNMTNLNLTVDGDQAESRANFLAWHTGRNDYEGKVYFMGGHYDDRWRRTPAGWRVAHRIFSIVLTEGDEAMMWTGAETRPSIVATEEK